MTSGHAKFNINPFAFLVNSSNFLVRNSCTLNNNNNNNNKRQFVRRRNMSVDITRAPYRQSGNVVRDSSTETRL